MWRQLNAKLEESAKAEFEDIVQERDAVGQLNELDRLVGEAKFRRDNGGQEGENVAYVFFSLLPTTPLWFLRLLRPWGGGCSMIPYRAY